MKRREMRPLLLFSSGFAMLVASFSAIAFAPPPTGKARLPCLGGDILRAANPATCVLGRNYVSIEAAKVIDRAAAAVAVAHPGTKTTFLDAGSRSGKRVTFHRSHGNGRQVDLALFFKTDAGAPMTGPPHILGYGAYEPRQAGETDPCRGQTRPMDFGDPPATRRWRLDEARTKTLVTTLTADPRVRRVFIAPHLKERLGLSGDPKVRFAGCRAARHDDHIHVDVYGWKP